MWNDAVFLFDHTLRKECSLVVIVNSEFILGELHGIFSIFSVAGLKLALARRGGAIM
jgi:hypothetical protein